jgi:hypothetical protein
VLNCSSSDSSKGVRPTSISKKVTFTTPHRHQIKLGKSRKTYPKCPNVRSPFVVSQAFCPLRIQVLWRSPRYFALEKLMTRCTVPGQRCQTSDQSTRPCVDRVDVPLLGETEIDENRCIGRGQHDIGRLDVVVCYMTMTLISC